jgi:hypothetical protein
VCELAIAIYLLVVTIYKCSINPITNSKPVYSYTLVSGNVLNIMRKEAVMARIMIMSHVLPAVTEETVEENLSLSPTL